MDTNRLLLTPKQLDFLENSRARINVCEGAVRSGKSHIALIRFLIEIKTGPPGPFLICGKSERTIKMNIVENLYKMIGDCFVYKQGMGELNIFGRTVYLVGAHDARSETKIRGPTFAGALCDEVTILPEAFFTILISRLSIDGAKLFATTNPDTPFHWFKRDYLDRAGQIDLKSWQFSLEDNPSLSDAYKTHISSVYTGIWYDRFIAGKWVVASGVIYDNFVRSEHVLESPATDPTEYIVGIDYGTTNPCVFLLAGLNYESYPKIWIEREYYYDSKIKMRQKTDSEYAQDLARFIEGKNVKAIYLDPSAASFRQELMRCGIYVSDANNDVSNGIRLVSNLLSNGDLKISPSCDKLIEEIQTYSWDESAMRRGIDKPKKENDHCFVSETLISTIKGKEPISDIKIGDLVLTRSGYKKVVETFDHDNEVYEYDILGKLITCTSNHPFLTYSGWKTAGELIQSDIFFIQYGEYECNELLNSMESPIDVIQILKTKVTENITELTKPIVSKGMDISIETCGLPFLDQYPKAFMYITSMEIPTTIALAICNVSVAMSIFPGMETIFLKIREEKEKNIWIESDLSQKNGTDQKKGEDGIENTEKNAGCLLKKKTLANNATISTSQQKGENLDFVRITVGLKGEEKLILMMRSEYVEHVLKNLNAISTQEINTVQLPVPANFIGKRKVFNLHVEHQNEYFAEGILVHNCSDALRYLCMSHFNIETFEKSMVYEDILNLQNKSREHPYLRNDNPHARRWY